MPQTRSRAPKWFEMPPLMSVRSKPVMVMKPLLGLLVAAFLHSPLVAQVIRTQQAQPTTSDGPAIGRRETSGPATTPLDDQLLPDAARSPWRTWFTRHYARYEAPPLQGGAGRGGLPPHLADQALRSERRDLFRSDVAARLALLLRDHDDRVRGAAAIALARGGFLGDDPAAVARMFLLQDDVQRRVREQSLLAAGLSGTSTARHRLLSIANSDFSGLHLQNDVERTRLRALAGLFLALDGEPALPKLVASLALDPRAPLQQRALVVQALGLSGSAGAQPILESLAKNEEEQALIRATAVAAMGLLGRAEPTPFLLELLTLKSSDTDVRAAAALAVGEVAPRGDDEVVRALVRAADHESNALVGRFLLLAIGEVGGSTARLRLERALQHESAEQRVFAELGLGLLARHGDREPAVEALLQELRRTRSQDEQCALLCSLGLAGVATVQEEVASWLAHDAPEVRRAALNGLALLGQPGSVALFEQRLLDDPAPEVRLHAARALGRLDPTCASLLIRELGGGVSRATQERAALLLALGSTGDPLAVEPLLDLLREPATNSSEREAATLALGLLYDPRRLPLASRLASGRSFLHESTELAPLLALAE